MIETYLTILRDRTTEKPTFRHATEQVSLLLAGQAGQFVKRQQVKLSTPLTETTGEVFTEALIIVPILRSGLAMLPPFLKFFPHASVGFFGMRRDETTKKPHLYYEQLPKTTPEHTVIIIDPMIATGGSGVLALEQIQARHIPEKNIVYVGIIAAPEGVERLKKTAPGMHLVIGHVDERLNRDAFIVPGIGDFGDRYFGTEHS